MNLQPTTLDLSISNHLAAIWSINIKRPSIRREKLAHAIAQVILLVDTPSGLCLDTNRLNNRSIVPDIKETIALPYHLLTSYKSVCLPFKHRLEAILNPRLNPFFI